MTPEQIAQLKESINEQIKTTVNGKIDSLAKEVREYIKDDGEWKEKDKEWKSDAQPSIDLGKKVKWGTIFIAGILGVGVSIVTIIAGLVEFIRWVQHMK